MAASTSPRGGRPPLTNAEKRARQAKLRTPSDRQVWSQLDDAQRDAYEAGRRRDPVDPSAPDIVAQAHAAGLADRADEDHDAAMRRMASQAKQATTPKTDSKVAGQQPITSSLSVTDDGAQFILGMAAYALFINYLRYGWPGVTGWLSAKFLNKVTITSGGDGYPPQGTPNKTVYVPGRGLVDPAPSPGWSEGSP